MRNKNTLFIGKVLHRFSSLSSTNDHAAQLLLSQPVSEGTVILTGHQTAGRGQMGNTWEAEAGKNLTLSVVLHPRFLPARHQFDLNQAVALAVRDTIAHLTGMDVKIKWPNDLLLEERKICGILIQNTLSGAYLQASIIGIGMNVNQQSFPPGLTRAGSMLLATKVDYDLEHVLWELLHRLEGRYLRLKQNGVEEIRQEYLSHLFRMNERHPYAYADGQRFYGRICDIDRSGKLMLETDKGIELFGLKEIQYLY
ncbi:MAG: biotin--[acetyl-CoA-carboxylase] ligase [Saprospiraceae bacterium]